jgi:glycosyltransferase involved in cell wall biosynthesis
MRGGERTTSANGNDQKHNNLQHPPPVTAPRLTIAMLADNEFVMDKRIHREAKALTEAGFDLTLYAVQRPDLPNSTLIDGIRVERIFSNELFNAKALAYLRRMARVIAATKPDAVHCHDWLMLHVGVLIKKINPATVVVYDSHELFHSWPIHYSSLRPDIVIKTWLVRQFEIIRERSDAAHIDHLVTVSSSIADHLSDYFKLRNAPVLVRNIAEFEEVTERRDFVRDALGIPKSSRIVLLFAYKIYRRKRNIEAAIADFANQPGIALVIFCHEGAHKPYFVDLLKQRGVTNVYFHPLIEADHIVNYLASCDVGLVPTWNRKHLSYWLGLENKLFHYVMSGLPVLASAQPEHKKIIEGHGLGVCVPGDRPGAYLAGLRTILANLESFKRNADAARHVLNWESEQNTLIELYNGIASRLARRTANNLTGKPSAAQ